MRISLAIAFLFLMALGANAQEVSIRIFSDITITSATAVPEFGQYQLEINKEVFAIGNKSSLNIQLKNGELCLKNGDREWCTRSIARLKNKAPVGHMRTRANGKERLYEGDFEMKIIEGKLAIINRTTLERYVAGVVEAEAGHITEPEFLKAQALIARTYFMQNKSRHKDLGYDLNDGVDAQVYFGKPISKNMLIIWKAVWQTAGEIITTSNGEPILAAFHSNSGGHTTNSEDAWSSAMPYLKSKPDPYSIDQPHYHWRKEIPIAEWDKFMKEKFPGITAEELNELHTIIQAERWHVIAVGSRSFQIKLLRRQFNLPSTIFDARSEGDKIVLTGRGFGHGVGFSQEGAMVMAQQGFSYQRIIDFYYTGVKISRLPEM